MYYLLTSWFTLLIAMKLMNIGLNLYSAVLYASIYGLGDWGLEFKSR
jgi:hypothetical protein